MIQDISDDEPCHVYVRCDAPPSWGRPSFEGIVADADKVETARSPRYTSKYSMVAWLVHHGVAGDRAEWMVDQILDYAREHSTHGPADSE